MASPLDEVLEALQALLDARRGTPLPAEAGRGNFRCERCVDCSHCRFCTDCTACEDCTYCEGCETSTSCTHCKHCVRCKQTTHSSWSSECDDSSYLTLCLDCESCVQCFACVGLEHEEFCVLNEKLPRKAYFSRVAALRGALEERLAAGWRPPWVPAIEPEVEVPPQEPEPPFREPMLRRVEPEPHIELTRADPVRDLDPRVPTRPEPQWQPEPPPSAIHRGRTEITVDIVEAETPRHPSRGTPPWTFADVRRGRATPPEDEVIPEPPPFGSGPHPAAAAPSPPAEPLVEARATDEPTRRRDRARPVDPPRDRYGWSAQAEGTPVRLGWSAQAEGEPERLSWSTAAEEPPSRWSEPRASRWGSVDEGSGRWSRPREEDDRSPKRKAWDTPPDRRDPHENDFDRRRRETAASPSAKPLGPEDLPIVHGREPAATEPDPRLGYESRRHGSESRTEADAPVVRRGAARADLSGAAVASGDDMEDPARRSETRSTPRAEDERADPVDERGSSRSLGVARRPERPRAPEPRDRGAVLLRGRAPARPTPATPPRQADAPSLRRARRPSRTRDELPTSEYVAVDDPSDDPERS